MSTALGIPSLPGPATTPLMVVNAGSSSLKLRILGPDDAVVAARDLTTTSGSSVTDILAAFVDAGPAPRVVGHRVVHGGPDFTSAVVIDDTVAARLARLAELAPLHNPPALNAVAALRQLRPDLAQVACFDTTFHAHLPAETATYAIPYEWSRRWGLRRYGFHGLSHAYASRRAAELLGRPLTSLRLVTAHIGSGASLAAVAGGASVDTTMGFTPMEGLVMATRPGNLDPGLVLWLVEHAGLTVSEIADTLEHRSGLLGLTGTTADLRQVIAVADTGDADATLAYGVYLHRLRALVASMAAAMGGFDALVFTGGAGEHSDRLRRDTCATLGFLGVELDPGPTSAEPGPVDAIISGPRSSAAVVVVAAREDLEIARQVRLVLGRRQPHCPTPL
ncbi:MAG: acetate/propionate family kinase [Actinomycetota bacterium]|nr:acetate/propionate family kinase [Actinomycetota bacterium]